jgi:hypothetical protein
MEHMNLIGSDDVYRGGSMIQSAASEMLRAASNFDEALFRHQRFMDDWLYRLEQLLNKPEGFVS